MYNLILFRYRAPGLPPEHPDCSRYLQNTANSCVRYIHCKQERMVLWPQAAQGHTPNLHLDPPPQTARLGKAHCGTGS